MNHQFKLSTKAIKHQQKTIEFIEKEKKRIFLCVKQKMYEYEVKCVNSLFFVK